MARIDELFRYLKEKKGSDLHLLASQTPRVRIHGKLADVEGWEPLPDEELTELLHEISPREEWAEYESCGDIDFAYGLPGVGRFRVNYLRQHQGAAAVFRIIPEKILTFDELNMPEPIRKLAYLERGLVLVTGPTGSGKSTTLASIINEINENFSKHIVTIEDPVEFVHANKKSVLSQREVGHDTASFSEALKVAIRQNADVIMVGEMRDLETISLAITAAEMGILVFGTLHTSNATKTIDRIVNSFPASQQSQIRTILADSICAVVSQLLLPTADNNGRCAAFEILLRTNSLPNIIRESNTTMLVSVIHGGRNKGMCTMDDSLFALADKGKVDVEVAMAKASDRSSFQSLARRQARLQGHA
ncbi:MAG: PilT/PilU family type 4a pilus ATPase [Xanthomonadales bacterium]|nr:PilT/PilU family type 4a pilus ATPase [Xanthomonadales bacterium]